MTKPREFRSVQSSMMRGVAYDDAEEKLYIEFQDGRVWEYESVPEEEYQALLSSSSFGSFFHNNIKGQYPSRSV